MGRFWRHVTSDSQLRWIGPDKGAIHLATRGRQRGGIRAKAERKPLWRLVADMVSRSWCARSTSVTDRLPDAGRSARPAAAGAGQGRTDRAARARRLPVLHDVGRLARLQRRQAAAAREAVDAGFEYVKLKVGANPDDIRRVTIAREVIGPTAS